MYRRQMKRGRRSRCGMEPMLERRTVWRDRSVSPAVERGQYAAGNTFDRHQNHSERRGNFTVNESSSSNGRPKYRRRERLDNNGELSRSTIRMLPTSIKSGPMENREYLGHELTKQYRGRDRLNVAERSRSKEIRFLHDEVNRDVYRIQPSEYGGERMQNYHLQTESQLATDEIAGKINNLANWRIEDLLGGQSMLNADSIQNAQTWIANDNSLSPAQIIRARELLQELLITITAKPDVPVASGNVPTTMRQAIYIEERNFADDRQPDFITDRRISDYGTNSSHNFPHQSMQSPVRSDIKIRGRELPVMHNSLSIGVPLIPTQNWRDDRLAVYSDSGEMPMTSRDIPKNLDFHCESRSDYPAVHAENPEFEKGNGEHDSVASEKRKSCYHDGRLSRSRSRNLVKDCEVGIGERRVLIKSRDFISVGVNHQQKRSRRNRLSNEADHRHHRENRSEKSLRHSSPLTRAMRRRRR